MAGPRTLIASLGASIALVVAAALSLLALSVVFAFGGWSGPLAPSPARPPLVFAEPQLSDAAGDRTVTTRRAAIVAPAPAPRPRPRPARSDGRSSDTAGPRARRIRPRPSTSASTGGAASMPAPIAPPAPPAAAAPPAPVAPPRTGDHVRQIGNSLSATVQDTGTALAEATQPLALPVSSAVQQVLNLVADVVRRTTDGLGNTLDALLPKR